MFLKIWLFNVGGQKRGGNVLFFNFSHDLQRKKYVDDDSDSKIDDEKYLTWK